MFYIIAGVGHCGTQWLASFLDRPDEGMVCWHEHKFRVIPRWQEEASPWLHAIYEETLHGLDESVDAYVDYMKQAQREVAVVGDAHSWEPFIMPALAERLPVDRIIYIVRNGIQNAHSHYYHNTDYARDSWLYHGYLRHFGDELGVDWESLDDWGRMCTHWAANVIEAKQLEAVAPVTTVTLEGLTSEPQQLIGLAKSLQKLANPMIREAKVHSGNDINRKIDGPREPEHLWRQWTDGQRETFRQVCGATMAHYGYEIPPNP